MYDAFSDGLTLDGLYEPDESAPVAPCRCDRCTKVKWMSWEEMQTRRGQYYVTGFPVTNISTRGLVSWAKKPSEKWTKWISQYETHRVPH